MNSIAPSAWKRTTFKSICRSLVNGGTPDTGNAKYWGGTTPWVTGADFTPNGIGEIRRYVSDVGIRFSSTNVVRAGNLLLVTRTGVGKLAIAPCDIAISQDITGVYLNENEADPGFVYFLMKLGVEELKKLNQGTSINGIIRSDLEKYALSIPCSLIEQRNIGHVLSTIENAIEETEFLVAKYQQIKAGLMHDLFTRGVTADGKLRPPREQAPELYQETPIGWIPKEWQVENIGKLFSRRAERGIAGLPVMSVTMADGLVPRDSVDRRVESNLTAEGHLLVRKGDIAYNMMRMWQGVLGRAEYDCLVSPAYVVMTPSSRIESTYAEYLLSTKASVAWFKRLSYGVVDDRLRLYARDLVRISLAIPQSLEEQHAVSVRLRSIDESIHRTGIALTKLRQQRNGLMRDLLTGKVSVRVNSKS